MAKYATTIKGLPVYEATLDEKGMVRVSLVTSPAVCKDFEAYDAQKAPALYAVEDEEKRLVFGVVMRANYPIYRRNSKGFEYFITHSPEMIRQMAEQFIADGNANRVDLQHDSEEVEGVQLVQLFIKDSGKGIAPAGFEEIEEGSLFGEYHVTNDEVWAGIKDGTFRGFSIEVYEDLTESDAIVSEEKIDQDVKDALGIFDKHYHDMKFWEKFKLAVDAKVAAEAEKTEQPAENFGRVSTDKGVLAWDGDEPLKEGDDVRIVAEDGTESPAPDDTYTVEDGKKIAVVDGKVASITDPDAEVEEGSGEQAKKDAAKALETTAADTSSTEDEHARFAAQKAEYEASYDEKYRAIAAAFAAAGLEAWIDEAADTWAVVEIWADGWKLRRYALTIGEDLTVSIGNYVDVKRAYIPADMDVEALYSAAKPAGPDTAELEAARTRITELEAKVAELSKQPAAPSAREQYRKATPAEQDAFAAARKAVARK